MEPGPSLGEPLRATARPLAEWAAEQLLAARPQLRDRYGDQARARWRADLLARIEQLAEAVDLGHPELFADAATRAQAAFAARGLPAGDLRASLEALREVLSEHAAPPLRAPATACVEQALARLDEPPAPEPSALAGPQAELVRAFLLEALGWRQEEACRLVLAAVDGGLDPRTACLEVLVPAQTEVGRLWHAGEVSVAQEHACSQAVRDLLAQLAALRPARTGAPFATAVSAAPHGDLHGFAPRVLAELLRFDGWRVLDLGAGAPADDVVEAAAELEADLLAVSVSVSGRLLEVRSLVAALRAEPRCRRTRVLVGGRPLAAVPGLWRELGADGSAADLAQAVAAARRLLGR